MHMFPTHHNSSTHKTDSRGSYWTHYHPPTVRTFSSLPPAVQLGFLPCIKIHVSQPLASRHAPSAEMQEQQRQSNSGAAAVACSAADISYQNTTTSILTEGLQKTLYQKLAWCAGQYFLYSRQSCVLPRRTTNGAPPPSV